MRIIENLAAYTREQQCRST